MNIFLKIHSLFRPRIKQSEELTAFYNAYNDWLEDGAPEENKYKFKRNTGLCENLFLYVYQKQYFPNYINLYHLRCDKISQEMQKQFHKAGRAMGYPFGYFEYTRRASDSTSHLDPNRIAWVKNHLTSNPLRYL